MPVDREALKQIEAVIARGRRSSPSWSDKRIAKEILSGPLAPLLAVVDKATALVEEWSMPSALQLIPEKAADLEHAVAALAAVSVTNGAGQ